MIINIQISPYEKQIIIDALNRLYSHVLDLEDSLQYSEYEDHYNGPPSFHIKQLLDDFYC